MSALAGGPGALLVLAAVLGLWEDGLVAGPALLFVGYVAALEIGHQRVDVAAPVVAAALGALVDLGCWSLELRERREASLRRHLRVLLALVLSVLATGSAVLAAGDAGTGGGIALWLIGAAAAAALLLLFYSPASPRGAE